MVTKTKSRSAAVVIATPITESVTTPCYTMEDRLQRISTLAERIDGHVQFIKKVEALNGYSSEAKERVVAVFCECLQNMEVSLDKIQENFRLE